MTRWQNCPSFSHIRSGLAAKIRAGNDWRKSSPARTGSRCRRWTGRTWSRGSWLDRRGRRWARTRIETGCVGRGEAVGSFRCLAPSLWLAPVSRLITFGDEEWPVEDHFRYWWITNNYKTHLIIQENVYSFIQFCLICLSSTYKVITCNFLTIYYSVKNKKLNCFTLNVL